MKEIFERRSSFGKMYTISSKSGNILRKKVDDLSIYYLKQEVTS